MSSRLNLFIVLTIMFVLSGCSSGSSGNEQTLTSTSPETWAGSYKRDISATTTNTIILYLNRSGDAVSGNYETTAGGEGIVDGTISDKIVILTLTQSLANCPGKFFINGQVSATGKDVVATFSGTDCTGVYSNGQARILLLPPDPVGTDFTGNYYGNNIGTLYFLSMSTQNGTDYSGLISVVNEDFTMLTAAANGSLGNDSGNSLMRMDLTDFVSESDVAYTAGNLYVHDMYQSNTGLNQLRVSWEFFREGGIFGTGGVYMYQLK